MYVFGVMSDLQCEKTSHTEYLQNSIVSLDAKTLQLLYKQVPNKSKQVSNITLVIQPETWIEPRSQWVAAHYGTGEQVSLPMRAVSYLKRVPLYICRKNCSKQVR